MRELEEPITLIMDFNAELVSITEKEQYPHEDEYADMPPLVNVDIETTEYHGVPMDVIKHAIDWVRCTTTESAPPIMIRSLGKERIGYAIAAYCKEFNISLPPLPDSLRSSCSLSTDGKKEEEKTPNDMSLIDKYPSEEEIPMLVQLVRDQVECSDSVALDTLLKHNYGVVEAIIEMDNITKNMVHKLYDDDDDDDEPDVYDIESWLYYTELEKRLGPDKPIHKIGDGSGWIPIYSAISPK